MRARSFAASVVVSAVVVGGWHLSRGEAPALSQALPSRAPAAVPEAPASPRTAMLFATGRETWVHAAPDTTAPRLGYLRAGGRARRSAEPAGHAGCRGGWYAIEPRGFVCVGAEATLDARHPVAVLSSKAPERDELPWLYLHSRYPPPPFYGRLPTEAEQRQREPDLAKSRRKRARAMAEAALPEPDPLPDVLAEGGLLPGLGGAERGVDLGRARRRSGFALLATYDHHGRRFGLTSELALVPIDRGRVVEPSALRGAELGGDLRLPIAIGKSRRHRYRIFGLAGGERDGRLETTDGRALRAGDVIRIDRFRKAPVWAERGDKWIDVSLLRQTLVAYEGTEPVFATLVSTGAGGIEAADKGRATVQGTFLLHSKHVTITMNSDEQGEEFDLRDVPFVQYFTQGYALHAAYWHDDFGRPRSHGCINLSPHDAAWLFRWTEPHVPEGWHAALSESGTLVHIHP
jgi:hypothetical protein